MKANFGFFCIIVLVFTSCKAPLPVYFDKPMGVLTDSFPDNIQGNYYLIDDIIKKGVESFEGKYCIKNDKIVLKSTDALDTKEYEPTSVKSDSIEKPVVPVTPVPAEENNFYKIAKLNSLSVEHIDSTADKIDKENKIAFAFIKITKNKISLIIKDSSSNDHSATLIQLNDKVKLSSYNDGYYINFNTAFGWEYIKLESWNNSIFLNIIPFYFTSYDDHTGDVSAFLKSTQNIYPDLLPIYNSDHLIVGLKAKSNPKVVEEKLKTATNNMVLMRVEQ